MFTFLVFNDTYDGIVMLELDCHLLFEFQSKVKVSETSIETSLALNESERDFIPVIRSGAWADMGIRKTMEDVYICVDDFMRDYGFDDSIDRPNAFYGVCVIIVPNPI